MRDPPLAIPLCVILSATCYADAEAAMPLSVLLTREVAASLEGLLVRDEGVLWAVQRPRARVVSFSGSSVRQATDAAMRRAFRPDTRLVESALFRLARQRAAGSGSVGAGGGLVVVGVRRRSATGFRAMPRRRSCGPAPARWHFWQGLTRSASRRG